MISDLESNSKLDLNHIDAEKLAYIEQKFREITGLDYNFAIVQQVIFPFLQDSFIDIDKAPVKSSEAHSAPCQRYAHMKTLLTRYFDTFNL